VHSARSHLGNPVLEGNIKTDIREVVY